MESGLLTISQASLNRPDLFIGTATLTAIWVIRTEFRLLRNFNQYLIFYDQQRNYFTSDREESGPQNEGLFYLRIFRKADFSVKIYDNLTNLLK